MWTDHFPFVTSLIDRDISPITRGAEHYCRLPSFAPQKLTFRWCSFHNAIPICSSSRGRWIGLRMWVSGRIRSHGCSIRWVMVGPLIRGVG
jgi:hypothetical protein